MRVINLHSWKKNFSKWFKSFASVTMYIGQRSELRCV